MVLNAYLNKLFYDLTPDYLNPIQNYLNDSLNYAGTIGDLITDFTRVIKRDNTFLTYIINLMHSNCITALFERYDVIEFMHDNITGKIS